MSSVQETFGGGYIPDGSWRGRHNDDDRDCYEGYDQDSHRYHRRRHDDECDVRP